MLFRLTRSGPAVVLAASSAVAVAGSALALPNSTSSAAVQFTGRQLAALPVPACLAPRLPADGKCPAGLREPAGGGSGQI
jgi:hypothetical protein